MQKYGYRRSENKLKKKFHKRGRFLTVSLLSAAVSALANQGSGYLLANAIPKRLGSDHPSIVPYGTIFYDKAQKPFVLAVGSDSQFRSLYEGVLGAGEVPEG